MRAPPPIVVLLAGILAACEDPGGPGKPGGGGDPPDPGTADTGDTADTADTDSGEPLGPGAHAWPARIADADLSILPCGSDDNGTHVLAPGPDLDGDGLPELAIGAPGHDTSRNGSGAVYFLRGSAVADGAAVWDADAVVSAPSGTSGFGGRVQWIGDRDGDGVDDLAVGLTSSALYTVSGADLLAGGAVTTRAALRTDDVRFVRWADVDYDGVDDWLFAYSSGLGTVAVVRDAEFTLESLTVGEYARGSDGSSGAGEFLAALHEDRDGDGVPELATILHENLHVISSAALLNGIERLVDGSLASAPYLADHEILAPGDLDGDGLDELVVYEAGNKLCVLNGADPTGDARICIRDEGLGTAKPVLGDDLDGDGVGDLWFVRDGWLVAQDLGALAIGVELELARVRPGSTPAALAAGDGVVWASPDLRANGGIADIAWAYGATLPVSGTMALRGGRWGGNPSVPTWLDVTGDGVVDLVLVDSDRDAVALFDGAALPAGGVFSWCDATASRQWPDLEIAWLDDVDGDGTADLLVTDAEDGTWRQEVWSGPVAVGLAAGDTPLASWDASPKLVPFDGCDFDGDGRRDLSAGSNGPRLYAGALGEDGRFPLLGALASGTGTGCVPDVDGDGADELYNRVGAVYHLYRSSELDPDVELVAEEAWLRLEGEWLSVPAPLRDRDGSGLVGWWFETSRGHGLCVLDLAGLSGDIDTDEPDAIPRRCLDGRWDDGSTTTTWLDAAVGDATPDVILCGRDATGTVDYRVVDGATLGADEVLIAVLRDGPESAGPGPDVLGVGAGAIWALGDDDTLVGGRRLDVLYAREAEESP